MVCDYTHIIYYDILFICNENTGILQGLVFSPQIWKSIPNNNKRHAIPHIFGHMPFNRKEYRKEASTKK